MSVLRKYVFALGPLAAAALWGGMYVVSKWSFALVPPVTLGFFRVALGAGALWLWLRVAGGSDAERPGREDWPALAGLGGWVTLTIVAQFLGTELTNASQGSLLTVLTPVFVVLLGAALLGERVTTPKAAGIALAAVGTAVVVAGQYDVRSVAAGNAAGVLLLVVASVAWAGFTVWGLPVVREYSALTAATYATIAATPMLGVLAAAELWYLGGPLGALSLGPESLLAIGYLGLASTAAAWYLWYKGLEYVPAGTVAVFFFLQPVVGTALATALLGEQVGPEFVVGSLMIGTSVWVVSRERAADTAPDQQPGET
ncbi:DMT family transporter [Haloarcula laminariae]|uniref:DMT family transporter n=1 Tax=Haloarcula laminariae TaxID=2961577 RepID=UPI0024056F08|nr:DMT family transporter [Halomicroarcula sp. FL173]